jgi:hypothetical protein
LKELSLDWKEGFAYAWIAANTIVAAGVGMRITGHRNDFRGLYSFLKYFYF